MATRKLRAPFCAITSDCLDAPETEPRRKTALGLGPLADLFADVGDDVLGAAIRKVGQVLAAEPDAEMENLLSAAFVRLSSEASIRRQYGAVCEVCAAPWKWSAPERPGLANELRPRIGVENRLPEFIEEALHLPQFPADLIEVLRRTAQASAEHIADRFFRCMRRDECDRMVDLMRELGSPAWPICENNCARGSRGRRRRWLVC